MITRWKEEINTTILAKNHRKIQIFGQLMAITVCDVGEVLVFPKCGTGTATLGH